MADGVAAMDTTSAMAAASMTATAAHIDRVAQRLAAIRTQMQQRQDGVLLPPVRTATSDRQAPPRGQVNDRDHDERDDQRSTEAAMVMPLLPTKLRSVGMLPSKDARLSMAALQQRARDRALFGDQQQQMLAAQDAATQAHEQAERAAEAARLAMLLYTQHERGWSFDERAQRYQQVLAMQRSAEEARCAAEDAQMAARIRRTKCITDPDAALTRLAPQNPRLEALKTPRNGDDDGMLVWLLAATTSTKGQDAEEDIARRIVYYAAPAADTASTTAPPTDGWLCCSTHGVAPAPQLTSIRSAVATWLVTGAGAAHVDGKYVCSGTSGGVMALDDSDLSAPPRFKAANGLELLCKRLPRASAVVRTMADASDIAPASAEPEQQQDQQADPANRDGDGNGNGNREAPSSSLSLPTSLRSVEQDTTDFRAMRQIGTWVVASETSAKFARQRVKRTIMNETANDSPQYQSVNFRDGDHVMTQDADPRACDQQCMSRSRRSVCAPLCREWVLFARCSSSSNSSSSSRDVVSRMGGLGCLRRHFFLSQDERDEMLAWAQSQEAQRHKDVLFAILQREAHLQRATHLAVKCTTRFQQSGHRAQADLAADTDAPLQRSLRKLLVELAHVRTASILVLEAIERWRNHVRQRGVLAAFDATYEDDTREKEDTPSAPLRWSASMTVTTGKRLFGASAAVESKYKRFCRAADPHGQREQHVVDLGAFATQSEAERAYDEYAAREAKRLNTTPNTLPRRRSVLRSCGRHYAVESEHLGPQYCLACRMAEITGPGSGDGSTGDGSAWQPVFGFHANDNYVLRMTEDLDFLADVVPLQQALGSCSQGGQDHAQDQDAFPLRGNPLLLPRALLQTPSAAGLALSPWPMLPSDPTIADPPEQDVLDPDRVLAAQRVLLQELQTHRPDQVPAAEIDGGISTTPAGTATIPVSMHQVAALYWDRCAALSLPQTRPASLFRQPSVWCRPDAGEWADLRERGAHLKHFWFDVELAASGRAMQQQRRQVLTQLRRVMRVPLFAWPPRDAMIALLAEAERVRGDVVLLEHQRVSKALFEYDAYCASAQFVQRWLRGVMARWRVATRRRALAMCSVWRTQRLAQIAAIATTFFTSEVVPVAMQRALRQLARPLLVRALKLDGERVIVSIRARSQAASAPAQSELLVSCCATCARRFCVRAQFDSATGGGFHVRGGAAVCTCSAQIQSRQDCETWQLTAYNPRSNLLYRLQLGHARLAQILQITQTVDGPQQRALAMTQLAADAARRWRFAEYLASTAMTQVKAYRLLSDEASEARKVATVALDRARKQERDMIERLADATRDAQAAMAFAARPFSTAQSWDPLEDANGARCLVAKRRAQQKCGQAAIAHEQCRKSLFQADATARHLRAQAARVADAYAVHIAPILQSQRQQVEHAMLQHQRAHASVMQAAAKLCCASVTMRDVDALPIRRALILQPAAWRASTSTTTKMLRIAVPGMRRCRNTLCRRAMQLTAIAHGDSASILLQHLAAIRSKRVLVDVSLLLPSPSSSSSSRGWRMWLAAYDPQTASTERLQLDAELIALLTKRKLAAIASLAIAVQDRARWREIARALLSRAMLDPFTGAFTLRQLPFFQARRRIGARVLASRWFLDLQQGRKCGDGDVILRHAMPIDGQLCTCVVLENWGDLAAVVYLRATSYEQRVRLQFRAACALLCAQPMLLQLWLAAVMANCYPPSVLRALLQHARFHREQKISPVLMWGNDDGQSWRYRFRAATWIQRRRVLVTIREAQSGDLHIRVLDLAQQENFALRLEWASVQRVVAAALPSPTLLLQRNRHALCEWLCTQLCFQNLLAHPDALLRGAMSPLVASLQVRASLQRFNAWIAARPRRPLEPFTMDEIDAMAAAVDAQAFGHLHYEQLAIRITPRAAMVDAPMTELGSAPLRVPMPPASGGSAAWHGRVDFFLRQHALHARVRQELACETNARLEQTARRAMDREDQRSQQVEIEGFAHDARETSRASACVLQVLLDAIDARVRQFAAVHQQLMQRTCQLREQQQQARLMSMSTSTSDMLASPPCACDPACVVVALRAHAFDAFAVLRETAALHGPLSVVKVQAETCRAWLEAKAMPSIAGAMTASAAALSAIPRDELQQRRGRLIRFVDAFKLDALQQQQEQPRGVAVVEEAVPVDSTSREIVNEHLSPASASISPSPMLPAIVISAFLVPADPVMPMEEVFLAGQDQAHRDLHSFDSMVSWFAASAAPILGGDAGHLTICRVHGTIAAFVQLGSSAATTTAAANPRVSALASCAAVGTALVLAVGDERARELQEAVAVLQHLLGRSVSSSNMRGKAKPSRQQAAPRLLPWKQLAMERLQLGRQARAVEMRTGRELPCNVPEPDPRETLQLATAALPSSTLEWMLGTSNVTSADVPLLASLVQMQMPTSGHAAIASFRDTQQLFRVLDNDVAAMDTRLRWRHLRVTVDDIAHPRYLRFVCREQQSQRQYAVDCAAHHLDALRQTPANANVPTLSWPRQLSMQTARAWRELARCAATHLALARKDGQWRLELVDSMPISSAPTTSPTKVPMATPKMTASAKRLAIVGMRDATAVVQQRIQHRLWRRHLRGMALDAGDPSLPVDVASGRECWRMTREAYLSQRARGLLVLDAQELQRLQQAVRSSMVDGIGPTASTCAFVQRVVEAMEMELGARASLIKRLEQITTAWAEAIGMPVSALRSADIAWCDLAEWWRRAAKT